MSEEADARFYVEQAQELAKTLAQANPTALGLVLWAIGQGTGGKVTTETTGGARLPMPDRLSKVGAGLVASDVLETGGSLIGDVTDLLGDVAGFALIAEGMSGTTVKEAVKQILPPPTKPPGAYETPDGILRCPPGYEYNEKHDVCMLVTVEG